MRAAVAVSLAVASWLVAAAPAAQLSTQAQAQIIAIAEEFEADSTSTTAVPGLTTHLRLGFMKEPQGWRAVCRIAGMEGDRRECTPEALDTQRRWHMMITGKRAGELTTSGWYAPERPPMLGMLTVVDGTPPRAGNRSADFAGWMGGEVHRPIVAVSNAALPRASGWQSVPLRREELAAVVKHFADSFPMVPSCVEGKPGPKLAPEHWQTRASFRAPNGERLFSVRLDRKLLGDCDGPPSVEWSDFWFVAPAKGEPKMIDIGYSREHAVGARLVEFADFDGDGKPELLLWQTTINEDGYVLLFDGFTKGVKAAWSYH